MAKPLLSTEEKRIINRLMSGAIRLWDVDLIKKCAETGADTQELLVKAIAKKAPEVVTLAIDHGARVDITVKLSEGVFIPLMHFAHDNFSEPVMGVLLAKGASVDTKNLAGETPALKAARSGDFDKMRYYLKQGADLDRHVQEVMISAVTRRDLPAIEWAVGKGADVQVKIKQRENSVATIMHIVNDNFREDIAEYFMAKGVPVDVVNSSGDTVLMLAARQADLKRVEFYLKKGANPLHTNHDGLTALDEAMGASEKAPAVNEFSHLANQTQNQRAIAKQVLQKLLDRVKDDRNPSNPQTTALDRDVKIMRPVKPTPQPPHV